MKRGKNNKAKRYNNIIRRIETLILHADPKTKSIEYRITLTAMYSTFKRKNYRKIPKHIF